MGFTLIEIIVCIAILVVIAGIFSINFIKKLNYNKEEDYKSTIEKIKTAADTYVTMHKESENGDYEDIKLVIDNDQTFTHITLDELKDDGLITDKNIINPKTGENLKGIVKFSKEDGVLDFEYIPEPKNYITIIYHRNGADSISRTAKAIECSSGNLTSCVQNEMLPSIDRIGGRVYGWSTNYADTTSPFKENTSLKNLLLSSNYEIDAERRLNLYAITSEDIFVYFEDKNEEGTTQDTRSCTIYNTTPSCKITMPDYPVDAFHDKKGWNTNIDSTGYNYSIGSEGDFEKNVTLYTEKEVKPFDIKINKLKRTSGTSVVPSNINIIFVLDTSGSMSSGRLSSLKTVTTGLVDRMNFSNSTVSLITFSTGSSTILKYDQDRLRIKSEINRLSASGGTNFKAAIASAEILAKEKTNDKSNFVIIVSDGYPTLSISPNDPVLTSLKSNATIYTMGIGYNHDADYMTRLATKPETYYAYDESTDDRSLSKFYAIFQDIVENITILEGDGEENAIIKEVTEGKLELGILVLSDKYPLTIYLDNTLLDTMTTKTEYLYVENGIYYFDIYKYAKDNKNVGFENMANLRIKYFYTEDEKR